jgi:signal transduction histidine kinase
MNIYQRKSYSKWFLAIAGMVIVLISLFYTKYLADRLGLEETKKARQYGEAVIAISSPEQTDANCDSCCDLTVHFNLIRENTTIPVFLVDEASNIIDYRNIGEDSSAFLEPAVIQSKFTEMVAKGDTMQVHIRNQHYQNTVVYSNSRLLGLLRLYPYLQFILIAAFIGFGYLAFSSSRRAEENQVWVGMAKETAHQLGTPITAIMGWIEHLRIENEGNESNLGMLDELQNDVLKLELIADRFSKIGSQPELSPVNIYEQLHAIQVYMKRRSPKRVQFHFPDPATEQPIMAKMNQHLLDWVFENLLRNSIDALENGEGSITCEVHAVGKKVLIHLTDTGKGVPQNKLKTVFKPGYTTKTRGWGLGLSLSKRIVEKYHGGKIYIARSEPGVATTFTIELDKA